MCTVADTVKSGVLGVTIEGDRRNVGVSGNTKCTDGERRKKGRG